jgi:hypothetical protein
MPNAEGQGTNDVTLAGVRIRTIGGCWSTNANRGAQLDRAAETGISPVGDAEPIAAA